MHEERGWQAERALLVEIHQNVVDILNRRAIRLLEILERVDYVAVLRSSVVNVMQRGDYRRALDNLRDFILESPVLDKMLPEIMDRAEPGLTLLSAYAEEYRLTEILQRTPRLTSTTNHRATKTEIMRGGFETRPLLASGGA